MLRRRISPYNINQDWPLEDESRDQKPGGGGGEVWSFFSLRLSSFLLSLCSFFFFFKPYDRGRENVCVRERVRWMGRGKQAARGREGGGGGGGHSQLMAADGVKYRTST